MDRTSTHRRPSPAALDLVTALCGEIHASEHERALVARRGSCALTGSRTISRRPRMRHEKRGEVFDDFRQRSRLKRHIFRKSIPLLYFRRIRPKGGC